MISAVDFSRKVFFAVCVLATLKLIGVAIPLLSIYLPFNIYGKLWLIMTMLPGALAGLTLGLYERMRPVHIFYLTAISIFYPTTAAILFLILIILYYDDRQ